MTHRPFLPIRGYLLHITHYDPYWMKFKEEEEPFNLALGLELIEQMAALGLNMLVIDIEDGVAFQSHPELKKHYTHPMSVLADLVQKAGDLNIEVVPKLNFAQSARFKHNDWFQPYARSLFDNPEYWQRAFQIIDEILEVTQPERFFHIGMDEDHERSYRQYVEAILTLRNRLAERKLRTVIWNDGACNWHNAEIHRDKSLRAEQELPGDIVQVVWDYKNWDRSVQDRIRHQGFELWVAPGNNPDHIRNTEAHLAEIGGTGILLTSWIHCIPANRNRLLTSLRTSAQALT